VSVDHMSKGGEVSTLRDVVFFSGTHVIVVGWEAGDATYAATAESTFQEMMATYRD
jgi:hypothetical protein